MLLLVSLFIGLQQILASPSHHYHHQHQECGRFNETQFYNQKKFLEPDEYPWLGRVGYQFNNQIELRCLAVLINERQAIMPAHCVREEALTMVFRNSKGIDWTYTIDELAVHPDYSQNVRNQANDIAIATLTKDVQLSDYAQPICLPPVEEPADNYVGQRLEVAGLALPNRNKEKPQANEPEKMFKVLAQIPSQEHCSKKYTEHRFQPSSNQICGYMSGDSNSMSGSPLMGLTVIDGKLQSVYLIGILSFGLSVKSTEYPDVFTRIQPYRDWINKNSI